MGDISRSNGQTLLELLDSGNKIELANHEGVIIKPQLIGSIFIEYRGESDHLAPKILERCPENARGYLQIGVHGEIPKRTMEIAFYEGDVSFEKHSKDCQDLHQAYVYRGKENNLI